MSEGGACCESGQRQEADEFRQRQRADRVRAPGRSSAWFPQMRSQVDDDDDDADRSYQRFDDDGDDDQEAGVRLGAYISGPSKFFVCFSESGFIVTRLGERENVHLRGKKITRDTAFTSPGDNTRRDGGLKVVNRSSVKSFVGK